MSIKSIAGKNNLILLFSLIPFFISLIFSLYTSSDTEYLSTSINIAGSQRMRTMLIANYSQQLYYSSPDKENDIITVLKEEKEIYSKYYYALLDGDEDLSLKTNPFPSIKQELQEIETLIDGYNTSIDILLEEPNNKDALNDIISNAMFIKDKFHIITNDYQKENDQIIQQKRLLDTWMLIFAVIVTLIGLFFSRIIRRHEYQAQFDQLTHLRNRYSFHEHIKKKQVKDYTIYFIDLNRFKAINDEFGHDTGDMILIQVASRLKSVFGDDMLYRFGGDEFLALSEKRKSKDMTNDDSISHIVNQLTDALKQPIIDSNGHQHLITLSMGIITNEIAIDNWEKLISMADKLMYACKKKESSHVVCHSMFEFDTEMDIMYNTTFNS